MTDRPDPTPADRLADDGWSVAVHNDYRLNGEKRTFWLFTHPSGVWAKGEGRTDDEALTEATAQAALRRHTSPSGTVPSVTREAIARAIEGEIWGHVTYDRHDRAEVQIEGFESAADAVLPLLTPAPAVTQLEPEAAPTREESIDVDAIFAKLKARRQSQESDQPPASSGVSVETEQGPFGDWRDSFGAYRREPDDRCPVELIYTKVGRTEYQLYRNQAERLYQELALALALAPQADVEQMRRERDKWHKIAMDLGCVVCTDGSWFDGRGKSMRAKVATLEAERDEAQHHYSVACEIIEEAEAERDEARSTLAVTCGELQAAEAQLAEATRLLEPFANCGARTGVTREDSYRPLGAWFDLGDLRRAAVFLAGRDQPEKAEPWVS